MIQPHCLTCRCQQVMAKQDVAGRVWERWTPELDKRPRVAEPGPWTKGHGDCGSWLQIPVGVNGRATNWERCPEPAAWRRSKNGRGISYLCEAHAREGGLPREVPTFATLEEAEAWLNAQPV